MAARGRKAKVDLVEVGGPFDDDGVLPDDGFPPDPDPGLVADVPPGPRGWHRIKRAWPLALVAVVVAGAYLVSGLRERAALVERQDVLRGQDGFVADLGPELIPLWSAEGEAGWAYPVVVEETLLVATESGAGAALVAFDVTTDSELWRVEHDPESGGTYCGFPFGGGEAVDGSVGCLHQRYEATDDGEIVNQALEMQLRDVRTGELRASRDMVHAAYAVPWRDAVLFVESDELGTELRLEGLDGAARWTLPFFDESLDEGEYVELVVQDDRGIVTGRDRAVVVDFDGTVVFDQTAVAVASDIEVTVDSEVRYPELGVRTVDGGWFALTQWMWPEQRTRVYDANGGFAYEFPGDLESIRLDDGSAGDVLLWRTGDGVVLADRVTGETRFSLDRYVEGWPLVMDGALVFGAGGRVRSIDVATGEERWSLVSGGGVEASDGVVVVVYEQDGRSSWLRALDLESGLELWQLPFTDPYAMVVVVGGTLYVHDAGTFSRLGR